MLFNFKKIAMLFASVSMIGGVALSIGINYSRQDVNTEAATTNTKRVWMKNSITSTWDADGAGTAIHYWGGAQGTSWPGVRVKWDAANSLVYYDVPADVTTYMFVRVSGSGTITDWGAKTEDLVYADSVGKYFDLTGPIAWGGATTPGSFVEFTPATTTIVANFAATIDTSAKACSADAAQAAVNAYNALSTFEQDQFDALNVGGGKSGLERLQYLKSFYNIDTALNALTPIHRNYSEIGTLLILLIPTISFGSLLLLLKKKH